jgi:hypothetical protein
MEGIFFVLSLTYDQHSTGWRWILLIEIVASALFSCMLVSHALMGLTLNVGWKRLAWASHFTTSSGSSAF